MLGRVAGILLGMVLIWPGLGACSQEPVIPRVAPRAANTLVMLPDGSTVHVELATTEAERAYGLMGRTSLPKGAGCCLCTMRRGGIPTGCITARSGWTLSGWMPGTGLWRYRRILRPAGGRRRVALPMAGMRLRFMCWSFRWDRRRPIIWQWARWCGLMRAANERSAVPRPSERGLCLTALPDDDTFGCLVPTSEGQRGFGTPLVEVGKAGVGSELCPHGIHEGGGSSVSGVVSVGVAMGRRGTRVG